MMIANDKCQTIREALQGSGLRLNDLIKTSHSGNKFKLYIFVFLIVMIINNYYSSRIVLF